MGKIIIFLLFIYLILFLIKKYKIRENGEIEELYIKSILKKGENKKEKKVRFGLETMIKR
jgi:hypothetical protein